MTQLSTPRPAMADSKCSIVEIFISSLIKAVDSLVSPTFSAIAGIKKSSLISVLIKLIPVLTSAGRSSIAIFLPVCSPMPTAFIGFLSVLCLSIYIFYFI